MTARLSEITERLLVGAIAIIFFLPLALAIESNNQKLFRHVPLPRHPWLGNRTLQGVTIVPTDVHFSWRALVAGDFQRSKAARFNEQFPGREMLIRWTNEAWFRIFHETASPTSTLLVGPNEVLFEKGYLHEYFLERTEKRALAPWVQDLRRLQDFCRQAGIGFLVVISPSKVSMSPDETPAAWRRRYDPRPRGYVQLVELFRENEILFVDAPALLAAERAAHPPPAPFFPKGGTHWNSRAVSLVANAILTQLREQGQPLEPMILLKSTISDQPAGQDQDLLQLMNLARPFSYPCEKLSFQRTEKTKDTMRTMAVIGGSFSWELIRTLSASGQFSEITDHHYYKLAKRRARDGIVSDVRSFGIPVDFAREIFGADSLLLEINEAVVPQADHHLAVFLRDALAHLPDPSAARLPFRSD